MEEKLILAHFEELKSARGAMSALREKGFTVYLDRDNNDMPDPDFSVSALMVGFLPDLAHGIFGTDDKKEKIEKSNAHLIVSVGDDKGEDLVKKEVSNFGGKLIEARAKK